MEKFHETIARPCRVAKVVDGDTLDVVVDLGFNIEHKVRLRFAGYNAPEVAKPEGLAAKAALLNICPSGKQLWVRTRKVDKFGRYLAVDLFAFESEHIDIIDQLVSLGFLKPVDGK